MIGMLLVNGLVEAVLDRFRDDKVYMNTSTARTF